MQTFNGAHLEILDDIVKYLGQHVRVQQDRAGIPCVCELVKGAKGMNSRQQP